jgi:ArsR family transcriptional regulator
MQSDTGKLIQNLKALADPTRLRLVALCSRGECTVSELTGVLGLSQPRVSQHLKQLCDADLLQRFRDGQFVYYRVPLRGGRASLRRRVLALLPADEPLLERDLARLRELRAAPVPLAGQDPAAQATRELHRALIELTVSAPLGDLLDVGCGPGGILKLLASRARRAVGVDIDSDVRQLARAELLLAGLENCSLRKGDMYALPFADAEFDTVVIDDVLAGADRPVALLGEARRVLRPNGRLLLLAHCADGDPAAIDRQFAQCCGDSGLRMAPARRIPGRAPSWIVAVATRTDSQSAAA